ncbi:MAG: ATP synthase subunit a [Parcubacteria group bacterium ADurb.Bin316]|nr:MAG: ATP synthase subunit a [Parcubacteria group bacterium ADurb.Bin316]HOZ55842.1 F0F1 ATP synthase subunit A [bacterium]
MTEASHKAALKTEIIKENTIYAEPIAHVGGFTITNSLINSWLVVFIIVIFGAMFKKKIKTIPGKLQCAVEAIYEYLLELFDSVTGSPKKSLLFFPFIFAFFIFILLNNWMGLLPGIGSIGQVVSEHGEKIFIPYFRGATADLNTTLALATIGVVASHIFGVISIGLWNHFNKFVNIKTILAIPKQVRQDPMVLMVNPINVFVGLIEIISEIAKVVSLSFRLFGNIFAGEVLLASMSAMLAFGLPLPFMFLEVLVGLVQAIVFSLLVLSYLTMLSHAEH